MKFKAKNLSSDIIDDLLGVSEWHISAHKYGKKGKLPKLCLIGRTSDNRQVMIRVQCQFLDLEVPWDVIPPDARPREPNLNWRGWVQNW